MKAVLAGQKRLRLALLVVILAACAAGFGRGYAIQLGAFPSQAEAQAAAQKIQADWSPVRIEGIADGTDFPYKVRVGYFPVYAEAWATKCLLDPSGSAGAFIVPSSQSIKETNRLPLASSFNTIGLDLSDPADAPLYWEAAGLKGPSLDAGASETVELLETQLALQPLASSANKARLRLARKHARAGNSERAEKLLNHVRSNGTSRERVMADFVGAHALLHQKNPGAALEKFRGLANNPGVPPSLRRESMRRAAGSLHKLKRYPDAWVAFAQLAENAATKEEEAEACMQQAGLAHELAGRGKGTWAEVRALCQVVFEDPEAPRPIRATAELMHLETYWLEGNPAEALAGAAAFLERYPDIKREAVMARLWTGIFQHKLGNLPQARAAFELAAEEARHATDKFAGIEPRAYAAGWSAYLAHLQGDTAGRATWRAVVELEYPNSPEAARLRTLLAN